MTNFNNFALTTKETQNVNGGRVMVLRRSVRRTTRRAQEVAANDFTNVEVSEKEEAKVFIETLHNNEIIL